jgi:hypothetical protein
MDDAAEHEDASAAAYVAAFVVYVAIGYFLKSLVLNWIVGPIYLVLALYVLPKALGRAR